MILFKQHDLYLIQSVWNIKVVPHTLLPTPQGDPYK